MVDNNADSNIIIMQLFVYLQTNVCLTAYILKISIKYKVYGNDL